jgi:DNA modification methylase
MDTPVLRVGDARDLSCLGLEPGSVDCIITSPPYWHLKRYAEDDEREIGHQQTKDEYLAALKTVFRNCFELAKDTGTMWLVIDTLRDPVPRGGLGELIPLPFELAEVAQEEGWRLQEVVIWQKNKTLPYSGVGKLRNLIEYVLFMTKTGEFKHRPYRCAERHMPGAEWLAGWPERYHPLGKRPSNVWQIDIDTQGMWDHSAGIHACPFPQELVARCVDLTTDKGDTVLDPFAGIGTVCAQAVAMGRRGYGLELNPDNVRVFEERVLSDFQATWEQQTEYRRLALDDQLQEAVTLFKLRLLKCGKELMRLVERLAQNNTSSHPAASVESVVVVEPPDLASYVDQELGLVRRPPAKLILLADLAGHQRKRLLTELREAQTAPPFTTFGLDITIDAATVSNLSRRGVREADLYEFGQSRHGAFTSPLDERLFAVRPKLLTTLRLPAPIEGNRVSPLDQVRTQAERRLLQQEVATGATLAEIAARVGLPQADLHHKLIEFGLLDPPRSFAIALPTDQLALSD